MDLLADMYNYVYHFISNYVFHILSVFHVGHFYHYWQRRKMNNDIQVIKADIQTMKKKLDAI